MLLISRRSLRGARYTLFGCFVVLFLDFLWSYQSSYPTLRSTDAQGLKGIRSVYIASTQWNSGTLLQNHWIPSLLQLTKDLKAANIFVFISIYENGSWDDTKKLLLQLKSTLEDHHIQHQITIDDASHEQIIAQNTSSSGWLKTSYGREMRRIPYLASVRNEALKPLASLAESGVMFDKIVYINDVVFSASDVINLLNTREGDYAAACALDFLNPPWNQVDAKTRGLHPPGMYDDFATRDSNGDILASHLYPYFSSRSSKTAVMSGRVVPVRSCWNGIVAFDAGPFRQHDHPLRFRGIPDSLAQYHVEASECCTIHYDNPLSFTLGVWINPAVRVGYSLAAYNAVAAVPLTGDKMAWPTPAELRWGYWSSKWLWWLRDPGPPAKIWYRIRRWQKHHPNVIEPGLDCVSDLAMVLTSNGWAMRGARFE
ncbi:MAG: hypothetical protein Q9203_001272 [Teloschistes exilis]